MVVPCKVYRTYPTSTHDWPRWLLQQELRDDRLVTCMSPKNPAIHHWLVKHQTLGNCYTFILYMTCIHNINIYVKNINKHRRNHPIWIHLLAEDLLFKLDLRGGVYNEAHSTTSIGGCRKSFPSRGRFWFKAVMYSQKSSCYLTSLEVCTVNLGGSVWVYQNTSRQTVVAWVCSGQMCCDIWVLCQKCCDISVYWLLIDPSCQRSRKHGHHGNRATHQP